MKAIIPVAGQGTRLRPFTHTVPKAMVNVAGKPMLGHILDQLESLDVTDVILVVGYLGEKIVDFVKSAYHFNLNVVRQEELLGLGHAIHLCKDYVDDEPALIILGDTIFEADLSGIKRDSESFIGVKEVRDPRRFGIVATANGHIDRLYEKPENPVSNLAIVGIYYMRNARLMFDCLDELITKDIRTKGEYQLTDALQMMLDRGEKMRTLLIDGWYDCGKPETLLETNRRLLESKSKSIKAPGSIIIEPVYIDDSVVIENSVVGPYVTIAEHCHIKRSVIRNTIINRNTVVKNMTLEESLLGENAVVTGQMLHLNVGDSSQIEFG